MASLKDIATASGVSIATVSKALNGHQDISEETRTKIKNIAKELGYFPNSAAKALKTKNTPHLTFVADTTQKEAQHINELLNSLK